PGGHRRQVLPARRIGDPREVPATGRRPGPMPGRHAVLRIAGTYVGTVVGAGFASGQEILRFFTAYAGWAWAGLAVAGLLLALFAAAVMRVGAATGADSHREVMRAVGGPWLGAFSDWAITLFLFAGAGVMMAGSGAIFREQWGLPA